MDNKGVLILGGVIAAGIVLVLFAKNQQTQTSASLQSQALAQQAAYQASTAGQVSGALASVGGFLNSGALGNLFQSFGASTPGNNDPGLEEATYDPYSNDPGLADIGAPA